MAVSVADDVAGPSFMSGSSTDEGGGKRRGSGMVPEVGIPRTSKAHPA
jgi:hypothetical protein